VTIKLVQEVAQELVPVEPKVRKVVENFDRPLTEPKPDTYVQELEGKVKELEKLGMWNESLKYPSVLYVLGLAPDASMEEAKARYKVLMRFWHTDICKLPMPWK